MRRPYRVERDISGEVRDDRAILVFGFSGVCVRRPAGEGPARTDELHSLEFNGISRCERVRFHFSGRTLAAVIGDFERFRLPDRVQDKRPRLRDEVCDALARLELRLARAGEAHPAGKDKTGTRENIRARHCLLLAPDEFKRCRFARAPVRIERHRRPAGAPDGIERHGRSLLRRQVRHYRTVRERDSSIAVRRPAAERIAIAGECALRQRELFAVFKRKCVHFAVAAVRLEPDLVCVRRPDRMKRHRLAVAAREIRDRLAVGVKRLAAGNRRPAGKRMPDVREAVGRKRLRLAVDEPLRRHCPRAAVRGKLD